MKSKVALFLVLVLAVVVLMAVAWLAIQAPNCQNPPNSWAPCLELNR